MSTGPNNSKFPVDEYGGHILPRCRVCSKVQVDPEDTYTISYAIIEFCSASCPGRGPKVPETHRASDWKAIKITGNAGKIVGIAEFKGDIIIAAEYGVFIYRPENNKLIPVEFEVEK